MRERHEFGLEAEEQSLRRQSSLSTVVTVYHNDGDSGWH